MNSLVGKSAGSRMATPFQSSRVCPARPARIVTPVVCKGTRQNSDLLNKTYYPTSADASNVKKRWYVIDAEGKTLGRLASLVAMHIRGKTLSTYAPSMDMGGYVVVVNAEKVVVTGNKFEDKTYFRHVNGRPGSGTIETFKQLQERIPERIIERAVKGMLPKGRLGRRIRLHLKVVKGAKHTHEAQQPTDITKALDKAVKSTDAQRKAYIERVQSCVLPMRQRAPPPPSKQR